jgi:hypothetical protein
LEDLVFIGKIFGFPYSVNTESDAWTTMTAMAFLVDYFEGQKVM